MHFSCLIRMDLSSGNFQQISPPLAVQIKVARQGFVEDLLRAVSIFPFLVNGWYPKWKRFLTPAVISHPYDTHTVPP